MDLSDAQLSPIERSDPRVAGRVIDAIFAVARDDAKRAYRKVLTASIGYLSKQNPESWAVTLFDWGVRLNAGWVESLVLSSRGLRILLEMKSAPRGTRFSGHGYRLAPGCQMTTVPLAELARGVQGLADSHRNALSIAANRRPGPNIRNAHSTGITKLWSLPNPSGSLHIIQGGVANGDKRLLQRAARESKGAPSWVAPKAVAVGDDVVIYIRGYGFFAMGRIQSQPVLSTDRANRYAADLESIRLIEPPISLAVIRRQVPALEWARYPRSVTTPSPELAEQIRALIKGRASGDLKIRPKDIPSANMDELWRLALLRARRSAPERERIRVERTASEAIRTYVLRRANGCCEACASPAPFRGPDGSLFLEAHHTKRLADGGPDHPANVIGLCPNCHRRAHCASNARSFNASLIRRLPRLELARTNR